MRTFLQGFLRLMSFVMVVAGSATVLLGAESVLREGSFTTDIDSEMRFYAVWYVAAGILLARAIPKVESETFTIRLIGAGFFAAGCARALSWIVVGKPHVSQIVLMVIELSLPFVIIPMQAAVARRGDTQTLTGGAGP
jgi:hypothetical protein